jgi:type 1 fimbria pilin
LVVTPPMPQITGININGTTLTITATNGADGGQFVLMDSTNLLLPLSQWTPILTNNFDGSGNLNLSANIINPNNPQEFYLLWQ